MRAHRLSLVLTSVLLSLILVACGGAPSGPTAAPKAAVPKAAEPTRLASAASNTVSEAALAAGGSASGGVAALTSGQPAPAATTVPAAAPPAPAADGRATGTAGQLPALDQKIIRTGKLEMVVAALPSAVENITTLAANVGGYVQQMTSRDQTADLVLRVPVDQFDAVVRDLRKLAAQGTRIIESNEAQDVTEQYADTEARITNLKATEAQLLKLLARAEKMEDILVVQRELTSVREQIERLQGQLNVLSRRAAMSTIAVTLRPQEEAQRPAAPALLAPAVNAVEVAVRPVFTWGTSPGATAYEVQLATEVDTTFTTPLLPVERLTSTGYELPVGVDDLRQGMTYRWRVRAMNTAGESDWTPARVFTTVPAWTPLRTVADSWAASLVLLQRFVDITLRLVVFSWWLILILVAGVFLVRRFRRPFGRQSAPPPAPPTSTP